MKYTIENINMNNEVIAFWGHQPSRDHTISKSCFSQWWISPFVFLEEEYKTAEHWMMAQKVKLFEDFNILEKIIKAETPIEVKKLGREVKNYNDKLWVEKRYEIVKQGNFLKFSQNELLRDFLINTNDSIIIESSPVDNIWGIGMDENHKDLKNPKNWLGLNLLGFALMEVRDILNK